MTRPEPQPGSKRAAGCRGSNKDIRKLLDAIRAAGGEVVPHRGKDGHYKVYLDGQYLVGIAGTPSDWRARANDIARLRRGGLNIRQQRTLHTMKLPGINLGNLDIPATVGEFLTTLKSIDGKLTELLEEQREANRNSVLDRLGRTSRERMARDRTTVAPDLDYADDGTLVPTTGDCSLGGTCSDPHDGVLGVGMDLTEGGTR